VFTYSSLYQGDVLVLGTTPASPPIPSPLPHGVSTAAKWLQHVRSVNPPSSSASLPSDSIDRSSRNALNSMDACKQNAHTVDERSPLKILSGDGGTAGPEGRNRAVESDHGIDVNKGEKEGEGERGGGGAVLIPAVHGSSSKDKDRDKDIDTNIASAPHTAPALPTATPTPTPTAPTERAITEGSQLIVTHHADDVSDTLYREASTITVIPEDDFAERTVRAAVHLLYSYLQ
jgi:hypothetical protein